MNISLEDLEQTAHFTQISLITEQIQACQHALPQVTSLVLPNLQELGVKEEQRQCGRHALLSVTSLVFDATRVKKNTEEHVYHIVGFPL